MLIDDVTIVTGAGGGIGRAVAERLAMEGSVVALVDIAGDRVEAAARALNEGGARAIGLRADVSSRADVEALVERVSIDLGPVTALVNNAAIFPTSAFLEITDRQWDEVMAVNLRGPFLCSQIVARRMISRGVGGGIVHIGSAAGRVARPGNAHYAASKAALEQLTRTMAIELAPHAIRVNCVAPGLISSEVIARYERDPRNIDEHRAKMSRIPLARMGTPAEVAAMVEFLLSSESTYVTGSILAVDGGYTSGIARYGDEIQ